MNADQIQLMGWRRLTWLQVGSALCLPILSVAYEAAQAYGVGAALIAIVLGNFLLFCLGHLAASISVKHRVPTTQQSERLVGTLGKQMFSLVMAATALGWFAIQLQYVAQQVLLLGGWQWGPGVQVIAAGLAVAMVMANYWGIEGIARWAEKTTPILIAALAVLVVRLCWQGSAQAGEAINWSWSAFSLSQVLALNIAYTIDLPTFLRFSKTRTDAVTTNWITILVVFSLVEAVGALSYWCYPATSLLVAFSNLPGSFWMALLSFYLVFQIWAVNHMNLFSAQTSLRVCFPKLTERQAWAISALFATALCGIPLLDRLESVLTTLGILVAGVGAIIYCEYVLISWKPNLRRAYIPASAAIALAASYLAGLANWGGVPVLEAFIASWVVYAVTRACLEFIGAYRERRLDYAR